MVRPDFSVASLCICWALLAAAPSHAQALSDEAASACSQPATTPEDAIAKCSAVISAGTVSGRQLAAACSLEEAEADLDQAIKTDPNYADAYANRANFWTVSKKFDRAMADAEQAVRLNPDLPIAHFVRAGAALNLGQYDRAIADYSETIRLRPSGEAGRGPCGRRLQRSPGCGHPA